MHRLLAVAFLMLAILGPRPISGAHAQDLARETYTGLGWSISWDAKIVRLVSTSEAWYPGTADGCNLALAYPDFRLCARNFDAALYPDLTPAGYDRLDPADNIRLMHDERIPGAVEVPDGETHRPAFASADRAWQLFAIPSSGATDVLHPDDRAIYLDVRRLSRDELVTLAVTDLTLAEFELAAGEIDAMLGSIEARQPTFTDPTGGWSVAWDHEVLRPAAVPDPDPETSLHLTEYTEANAADGLDVDIFMAQFAAGPADTPDTMKADYIVEQFQIMFGFADDDELAELPEGYDALQTSTPGRASGFVNLTGDATVTEAPDVWSLVDVRVLVPGQSIILTLIMWDSQHSEELLPVLETFLSSFTLPPIPR